MVSPAGAARIASCRPLVQAAGSACRAARRCKFYSRVVIPSPTGLGITMKSNQSIAASTRKQSCQKPIIGGHLCQQSRSLHQRQAHRAFIALGSNLGDRVETIEEACRRMNHSGHIKVLRTSSLWETEAMYVLDQEKFVNGACEVSTFLSPMELLDQLQAIENAMGRVKVFDKGPRNIDLDILLYDEQIIMNDRLQVPHKLMLEREFVLRPLCQLIPDQSLPRHDTLPAGTLQHHLSNLPPQASPMSPMTLLGTSGRNILADDPRRNTRIMSILNITQDSFSDGGKNFAKTPQFYRSRAISFVGNGAHILDIGGQSTRPGAEEVSSEEELSRVLPAIKAICNRAKEKNVPISVDTYRADVAEKAIKAGAHMINDVSAGLMDDAMLPTVAKLGCTICLMHMRGTPKTMHNLADYPDGIIETVGRELRERVEAAEAAGIFRWRIILDPGIGFAKTTEHNLEILRRLGELRKFPGLQGIPWLVGASRKKFIGDMTGEHRSSLRDMGTAAAVTAAIQGGADIVRVHNVKAMSQVARMADALWRV